MSAVNWAVCPRCTANKEAEAAKLRASADAAYGKLGVDAWKEKDAAAKAAADDLPLTECTFREDYEIGVSEGFFSIDYRGVCSVCGLSHGFKHEEYLANASPTPPPSL
jgi:hypothetical protein